jgi:O-antigen/teichoic acid export membrane protein
MSDAREGDAPDPHGDAPDPRGDASARDPVRDRGPGPDPLAAAGASGAAARGGAMRAGAWVASAALSLVSIPLLVRHLGVPEFGRYIAVLAVVNIASLASDLGLTGVALREWGGADPAERRERIRPLFGIRFAVVTVAALVVIAFAALVDWPARMVSGTAIAAFGLYGIVFTDLAIVGLAGSMRFRSVAIVEVARSAIGTALIVVLVIADAGLTGFYVAWTGAMLATAVLALTMAGPLISRRPTLAGARELITDTAPYAAAAVAHVVYFRAVVVITSIHATARQAGLYATVFRVTEFAAAVGSALAGTVTPVLAHADRNDPDRFRRDALKTVRNLTAAGTATALVLGLGAPLLMQLIGGDATDDAVDVMRIQAPALIATFASFAMGAILLVLHRYRALLVVNIAALAATVTLALILVPDHGAKGGAVAVLVGEWLIALAQAGVLWRAMGNAPEAALTSGT